jgi:hypothetical protein
VVHDKAPPGRKEYLDFRADHEKELSMKLFCPLSTVVKLAALCLTVGLITGVYVGDSTGSRPPARTGSRALLQPQPGAAVDSGKEVFAPWRFTRSSTWSSAS